MTSKIASEVLKASSIQQMGFCKVIIDGKSFSVKEALDTAIEVLEQEPCEDCISRQEAINAINQNCIFENEYNLTASRIKNLIQQMPSVTPKEKTGRWIDEEFGSKCSCCNIHTHLDKFDRPMKFKYCSMCGAKMEVEK